VREKEEAIKAKERELKEKEEREGIKTVFGVALRAAPKKDAASPPSGADAAGSSGSSSAPAAGASRPRGGTNDMPKPAGRAAANPYDDLK